MFWFMNHDSYWDSVQTLDSPDVEKTEQVKRGPKMDLEIDQKNKEIVTILKNIFCHICFIFQSFNSDFFSAQARHLPDRCFLMSFLVVF